MFAIPPLMLAQEDAPPIPPTTIAPGPDGNPSVSPQAVQQTPTPGVPGTPGTTQPPSQTATRSSPDSSFLMIIVLVMVAMVGYSVLSQRKEKKKRASMLSDLKKGNKVQTVGGILGTVVETRDNEVVVKVDENTNTRLKFTRGAIQNVLNQKDD